MLAATDPVANPAAAGVTEPEPSDAQGAENGGAEAMVTSEHMLARMDGLLSRGEDRPTPLFYVGVAAFVPWGVGMLFGTFCTPSLADAAEDGDVLMGAAIVMFAVVCIVVGPLFNLEARRAFRADAAGPLVLLGAGQLEITAAQDKALRAFDKQSNITWGSPAGMLHQSLWTILVACEPRTCHHACVLG